MSPNDPRHETLHPDLEDNRPTVRKMRITTERSASPRTIISTTDTVDALERLCTGTIPEETVIPDENGMIPEGAPTIRQRPAHVYDAPDALSASVEGRGTCEDPPLYPLPEGFGVVPFSSTGTGTFAGERRDR